MAGAGADDDDLDGRALPAYASEANKQIDAEIKRKEGELEKIEDNVELDGGRVKVMTEHLVNVQQELVNTQQLVDAKKHEVDTEEHLKALSNRQLGRLRSEQVRLQKLLDDTQDQVNTFSNELMRGNERLDQFKLEMNWNQEELEQWAIAARQKEEDELTIEKYKRADDSKVRELTLAIEKLTYENAGRKKDLAEQVTETQAKQIEMDKTAELFKQLHDDRKKLITQWEESVNSMQTRDKQLENLGKEYASNLQQKQVKEGKMKEKRRFYDELCADNEKMDTNITQGDRQLVRLRQDYMNVKGELTDFKDEVEVLKNQLSSCENEKTSTKNQLQVLMQNLERRKNKHQTMTKNLANNQRALGQAQDLTTEKDKGSHDAEKDLEDMMNNLRMVEKEMKAAKDNLYKESQELYRLRADEATTLGEISGNQSAIKNLQFQISRLDQERQRQQELLYAVDFQSQLMQRKVARVSGERTVEEREEFNKKVEQLTVQIDEQKGLHSILTAQIKRQNAELKNAGRSLEGIKKDNEGMKAVMEELELQNTIVNRTVANTMKDKEESLMQHDILQLEVRRLKQHLGSKSENVYSLENRKQQLQISMEEREKEVEVHTEVLKAQLRTADEERHKAAVELGERKTKIYNLKMKYENVVNKMKKEDGEQQSQAHFVIKAAQEKEELQRQGDELDDKIRRAEKEIRALENTLGHLVSRNQRYKDNFQSASQQSLAEVEEKQMLEDQSRAANEVLFKKKKMLDQLEREGEEDAKRYDQFSANLDALDTHLAELTNAREALLHDIEEQTPKVERAEQSMQESKQRAVTAGVDLGSDSAPTLDIETKGLRDMLQSLLYALGNALQDHVEDVLPLFERLCDEKEIMRPSVPPSAPASAGSSRASSPH